MDKIILYITIVIVAVFIIISKIFSPAWLLILSLALLWHQRRDTNIRPIFLINIMFLFFYFVIHYFSILVPFIIGVGLAYILTPLVDILQTKKVPKVLAILILLLPIIAILPLIISLITINLVNDIQILIGKIPDIIYQFQLFFGSIIERFREIGIMIDPNIITNTITTYLGSILTGLLKTFGQLGQGIRSIIMLIYNLVFIPLSAYLFLSDREKFGNWFRNVFSEKEREKINEFIDSLNLSFARFVRGQIIFMLTVGFIVGFALWVMDIKYYFLLSLIAMLGNLIPNVGFVLSFIPATLIGLISPSPLVNIIKIVCVYVGEQLLENFLLGPLIIGRASRLHPVVVIIVLILSGAIFGFWGVVLAIPATIFIREFLNCFLNMKL